MNGGFHTDNGTVIIDNKVIARMAGLSALECFGIVGMAALSRSDGLVKLLTRNSITKGVKVDTDDNNNVTIDFHVIVAYYVSIRTVAENLMSTVIYRVENFTGMKVDKVNVYVEGVRYID